MYDFNPQSPTTTPLDWDWGIYLRLNQMWNVLDMADFKIDALQTIPQTLNGSATSTTVIFDQVNTNIPNATQYPPNGF